MAAPTGSRGNSVAYFIIGAVVAAIVGYGIYYFTEGPGGEKSADVEISISENGLKVDAD